MNREQIYDFIGELAIALYSKQINISLSALNAILADKGVEYGNNRGLASGVAAAYRHWEKKDPVIYHAIAFTFRDKNGNIPWD
ncbi:MULTISPECIES: hypothetical protein [Gammaproteobacteria]|jgi:hypothetical protein|uniref:hypothetical protein n=1 Tax=Gammaproteobacteria TaxID=1236 RepID=UPI001023D94C|nr:MULTISPECIES: hypothetical protein [Gammaproteobacteria]MBO1271170.1 hypothetical protein [Shewanella sp. 4t3-1-2LB]RZP54314.1 hypothetical protein D8T45_23545 [Vibrio vulnificus]RZR07320.1 hypothetical protein D8T24_23370 [Vibrio vulnificus]HAS8560993.1 hypothetical protein [Vibrio vulnificus]